MLLCRYFFYFIVLYELSWLAKLQYCGKVLLTLTFFSYGLLVYVLVVRETTNKYSTESVNSNQKHMHTHFLSFWKENKTTIKVIC